ncbi:MAG TPA: mycofactocin biosynthesis glycosyltransferase MftF, partial [Trebonia sp.]|nr:mycofactocin biosynthesis glycosyltransferase MftF [Trebonia sp.]
MAPASSGGPLMAGDRVPPGFRLRPDAGARLLPAAPAGGGAVLAGGSPARVLRLTASGARQVAGWLSGIPVPVGPSARALARRLLDAGIAHPDLGSGWPGAPARADVTVVIPVRDRHDELARCLAGLTRAPEITARGGPRARDPAGVPATGGAAPAAGRAPGDPAAGPGTAPVPGPVPLITARGAPQAPGGGGAGPPGAGPAPAAVGAIIVVDDCSADPAAVAAIARAAGARVIRRPVNGGPGAARNTGLAAAATPLVAFLDSDCVPAPGWLDALLPHFTDPAVGAVAPRIAPHEPGRTWLARYEGASSTLDMGARPSIVRPGARVPYVPGAALVVRRAAAGDGFAAGLRVGEDVDFAWRLAAAGWRVRYEPAAVMGHQHRVRLRAWMSRRADYGTSAALLEELHPGSVRPLYASWWTVAAWAAALGPASVSRRLPGGPVARWRAGPPVPARVRLPQPGAGRLARLPSPAVAAVAGLVGAGAITATAIALLARRLSRVTGESWPVP